MSVVPDVKSWLLKVSAQLKTKLTYSQSTVIASVDNISEQCRQMLSFASRGSAVRARSSPP
ncbi:MAG: hypothetical protein LBC71_03125 [Oscillospiraceae bacterium]|jgi:hypothetical protein|nr:hypothetical protein [Oscillospiraceae bacterium]